MDTICVYKDKLNEALTLVPSMSQAKKLEAVSYWNNAASHFQQIVNDNSSLQDQPTQHSDSTGQNSSLDYHPQASDMNPTVILDSEDFTGVVPEQAHQTTPENTIADDLSVSKTPTTSLFQRHDPAIEGALFDSDYLSANLIGDMQQLSSATIDDEINLLASESAPTITKSVAQSAYAADAMRMQRDCAVDCPLLTMHPCTSSNQQYQSSVRTTGDNIMNNITTLAREDIIVEDTQMPSDNSVLCTMLDGSVQPMPIGSEAVEVPNLLDQIAHQTHSSQVKSNSKVGEMQAMMPHCPRQTTIHDIGNGQYDRGPGHGLSRGQIQVSLPPPIAISDSDREAETCAAMSSVKNTAHTHGIRPLQQIQIFRKPTTESNQSTSEKLRTGFFHPNQQRVNDPSVQQRYVIITSSALVTPPACSSSQATDSQHSGIKLEGSDWVPCTKANSDQHTCEMCGKSGFSTKGNLKRHRKAHAGEKPYQCNHCESKFTEKKSLKIHLRRHTGEKPYKCTVCEKLFSQTGVLKSHMALHMEERKFNCDKCDKAFRQRSQLKLHLMRHDGIKKLECSECRAKFLTKGDLERHFRTHTGERPYSCEKCGKTFTRQQSLNEHMNRHVGRKPFNCKHCDKSFSEMSACYKHAKIHKRD